MLNCCNKSFKACFKFYAIPHQGYKLRQVLFSYCPNKKCGCAVYKEILTDFDNICVHTKQLKGLEAEKAYKKAKFNQITYFNSVLNGTKDFDNWYFGDFEKTNKKDEKGNFVFLQLKRNWNNKKEVLGYSKIIYN